MICAILLSALLSPHAAGNSPAYSSLPYPQQYTQKRRKKKKGKAFHTELPGTKSDQRRLPEQPCIVSGPVHVKQLRSLFFHSVCVIFCACMQRELSLQVEGPCKRPKVNGRPSGGLPLSPHWESALQSAITFPLAMLLHSAHSHCPPAPQTLKI